MDIFTHNLLETNNLLETTFWEKVEPKFNANSMRIQCYFLVQPFPKRLCFWFNLFFKRLLKGC